LIAISAKAFEVVITGLDPAIHAGVLHEKLLSNDPKRCRR
jgi:hypothetical protein